MRFPLLNAAKYMLKRAKVLISLKAPGTLRGRSLISGVKQGVEPPRGGA